MAKREQVIAGSLIAIVVVGVAIAYQSGKTPSITLAQESVGQSYSPFVWWMHSSPAGYFHHYPERIGVNTLPQPYQTEDIGMALKHVEPKVVMDYAGCAQ